MMKLIGNTTILVAGFILMIGGLIAVAVMFLGATAVALLQRITSRRALTRA
jgi:hypothetical protein